MHPDRHVLGLFPRAIWEAAFAEAGFPVQATMLDGAYAPYLLGNGTYPQLVFVGTA